MPPGSEDRPGTSGPAGRADALAGRLLALLQEEAESLVLEGRASVHLVTTGEQYGVDREDADQLVCVVRPARAGALPVCLLPEGPGWYLLPGDGPSVEFWAGTDADVEETRALVRAVVTGRYRYAYEQRSVRPLLARWRPVRSVWTCTGWVGDDVVTEHVNAAPDPGEALEVRAVAY